MKNTLIKTTEVDKITSSEHKFFDDQVMIEEPLQINTIEISGAKKPSSITMRSPGHDADLALGFMYNEGMINHSQDILKTEEKYGEVDVYFSEHFESKSLLKERNFYITSSCGVCGKSSIEELKIHADKKPVNAKLNSSLISKMYQIMSDSQTAFNATGGCHGAGVFDYEGNLVILREDVGRHNAVDKCGGYLFKNDRISNHEYILCLSGRSCYELIQKAIRMNCSTIISIGAATSLAIETAKEFNISLIGFYKKDSLNIYAVKERIV